MTYNKKVIPFKSDDHYWTFLSVVTDLGVDVATNWDADQTFAASLSFDNFVKTDRKTINPHEWTTWRHKMHGEAGKCGVVELGFKADGRQYRVLSMFHGAGRLVVLCVCYHKNNVWTPKTAIEIATQRAKQVTAGKAKLNVIEIADHL